MPEYRIQLLFLFVIQIAFYFIRMLPAPSLFLEIYNQLVVLLQVLDHHLTGVLHIHLSEDQVVQS